jgi:N-glycosylase/DNA lyase
MWSDWQSLPQAEPLTARVLAEILDGGQAFRWHARADGSWVGAWADHVARLRVGPEGLLEWSAPATRAAATGLALVQYWDAARPTRILADALPWRSDSHLARALAACPGLRILRQPFGETLLGFMCSAAKQIVQIKQMTAALAERHGHRLLTEPALLAHSPFLAHQLPTWEQLAEASEPALRACRLGFRARHIHGTARFLAARPGWLAVTESLPYPEARARLCELPGVGPKVADCVLLFGAGRLEAFPVDVWIIAAMARHYGLSGWKPDQIAHFGRMHFGPFAGFAQQYLFAWERKSA